MAKELMEIGGFITSGAEIVNHDNSLSGNGTVDSPLGLNETVLYSGAYNGATTSYALSDNISNFEKIKVYGMTNDSDMLFTEFYTSPQPRYFSFFGTWSGMQLKTRCYVISNNTAFNNFGGIEMNLNSTTTSTHQHIGITKVVGINRKANN